MQCNRCGLRGWNFGTLSEHLYIITLCVHFFLPNYYSCWFMYFCYHLLLNLLVLHCTHCMLGLLHCFQM